MTTSLPLKWPGGKSRVMPDLLPLLPKADCLIEPFVGGASVFMNTDYPRYVLADINPHLINFYQVITEDPDKFIRDAKKALFNDGNNQETYYSTRAVFNISNPKDWAVPTWEYTQAIRFLYLNRHCYNGVIRYNQKGQFNTPYGHYKKPYFPENEIRLFAEKARDTDALFLCADFRTSLLTYAQPDTAIYCDPPYLPASATANFTNYHTAGFDTQQHETLIRTLLEIHRQHGVKAVISGSDTPETRLIYAPFLLHKLSVQRSAGTKNRGKAGEVIGTLRVCESCKLSGGCMCPDCGPVMGDATYKIMRETREFKEAIE